MTDLIPIQTLNTATVRSALRDAVLQESDPVRSVADFLLGIDWSTVDGAPSAGVADLLGDAEAVTTEAEEGDITVERFVASMLQLIANQTVGEKLPVSDSRAVTIVIPPPPRPSTTLTLQAVG